ncbi:MAG: hypothetical protein ACREJT_14515, partial [Myxococcota bacterium]
IELRLFAGQNQPWTSSRFERVMQDDVASESGNPYPRLLMRGTTTREETSEFLDQLTNVEMVRDLRDKVTLFSSTRNDRLPPWLWWEPRDPFGLNPTVSNPLPAPTRINDLINAAPTLAIQEQIRRNFLSQSRRKLDLRDGISTAVDPGLYLPMSGDTPAVPGGNDDYIPAGGELSFHERLPYMFQLALIDFDGGGTYGSTQSETEKTAAGLAANLEAYRNRGDALQYPAVNDPLFLSSSAGGTATPAERANLAVLIDPNAPTTSDRMLGVERQPFILEAFIAHVYPASVLDSGFDAWYDAQPGPPTQPAGGNFDPNYIPIDPLLFDSFDFNFNVDPQTPFVDNSSTPTTIAVVQIANPFT